MGKFIVDTSEFPLVICRVEGALTDAESDQLIQQTAAVFERKQKFAIIQDASQMGAVSAYLRNRTTQWQREHLEELKAYCVGTAYVLKSPLMRFIAMTVFLVTRLPTPLRVCENEADAVAWAKGKLAEAQ